MLGNIIPGFKVFSTLVGLALFAVVAWWVYDSWFAPPDDLTSAQKKCLEQLLPEIADEVRRFADENNVYGANVARFAGDTPNSQITHSIRAAIDAEEGVTLLRASVSDRLRDAIQRATTGGRDSRDGDTGGASDGSSSGSGTEGSDGNYLEIEGRAAALEYVKDNRDIGFVVWGETRLSKSGDDGSVQITVYIQGKTPEARFPRSPEQQNVFYRNTWDQVNPDAETFSVGGGATGAGEFIGKLLVFLIVAFFLPIVTGPLAVQGFRKESNLVNFSILVIYTLLNGLLAWVLIGLDTTALLTLILVLVAMIVGGFWNYHVCSVWERRA